MANHENGSSLPVFHTVHGLRVPGFVPEPGKKLREFKLYPEDVYIVTYPKCGTTWTSQIVRLIRSRGVQDSVPITSAAPWLEGIALHPEADVNGLPRPRTYTSHFPYHLLPCGLPPTTPCKYIYVMRNPKDVAVSLYFFVKLGFTPDWEWDEFWRAYTKGEVMFGNYFDHLSSWWPHRNDKNMLFLKFEDMKRDTRSTVAQIASFIGEEIDAVLVTKISDMVSFQSMKHDNDGKPMFMRKGVVGDWKNYLTAEQSAQIDVMCKERLKGMGLEFQYE